MRILNKAGLRPDVLKIVQERQELQTESIAEYILHRENQELPFDSGLFFLILQDLLLLSNHYLLLTIQLSFYGPWHNHPDQKRSPDQVHSQKAAS